MCQSVDGEQRKVRTTISPVAAPADHSRRDDWVAVPRMYVMTCHNKTRRPELMTKSIGDISSVQYM